MKLRVRYDHWLAKRLQVQGIVLYPFVLFDRARELVSDEVLRHEMIHVRQVRAEGFFRFYLSYLGEYSRCLAQERSHDKAYRAISFEREAYAQQATVQLNENEAREIGLA